MKIKFRNGIVIGCITAALGSGYVMRHDIGFINHLYGEKPNTTANESPYIYFTESAPPADAAASWSLKRIFGKESRRHWHWLSDARSKVQRIRHEAVKALGSMASLSDSELCEIAQACDCRTSVGLARTASTDLRCFLSPPPIPENIMKGSLQDGLRSVLSRLPEAATESCISFFTANALHTKLQYFDAHHDKDDTQRWRRPAAGEAEMLCLQALLSHTALPEHRRFLVEELGVLPLLQRVLQEHAHDMALHSLVAQMVANLALDSALHDHIFRAGWVGILARWLRSSEVLLSFPAGRALANMDTDSLLPAKYEDGIYLLHPQYRLREPSVSADIIFVHGLLGSVFKTWRQHDSQDLGKLTNLESLQEPTVSAVRSSACKITVDHTSPRAVAMHEKYTKCWPKSWLAEDMPYSRILALDYDTYLSQWSPNCPLEPKKRTLVSRATDMLTKLHHAGVGERPIIWITHSMGGLLVKEMLAIASESPKYEGIARNTSGVVFYAVPHRGADLGDFTASFKLLLLPSVEVQELEKESPHLLEIHDKFEKLVKKFGIPCLSFGERVKTVLGFRMSKVLVPVESADPGFGDFFVLDTSHLEICKPHRWSSFSYQLLLDFLDHAFSSMSQDAYWAAHNPTLSRLRQLELYFETGVFQF
ncbi:protein SERAC1 [Rhipicephalus microplus]|uniref:protein SERAC1 n=1 Tax=Rhipicephalus microplus TaxID=6941 RepID=UPI00188949CD|nr:protein SERAC1-like [Rhipicephalus microplus]